MHKMFEKKNLLTIPNLLSVMRILMIGAIVWLYCVEHNYLAAIVVLLISGATDIADGFIARKFNMTSDFGKILDPIADKLTQASVIFCLATRYKLMIALVGVFAIREICMLTFGYLALQKGSVNSAKWYGKLNTVVVYFVLFALVLFPQTPENIANVLILVCIAVLIFSLICYSIFYKGVLSEK